MDEGEKTAAREVTSQYVSEINSTPILTSLLYDADLLPEQIVTMRGAISMAAVVIAYREGVKAGMGK